MSKNVPSYRKIDYSVRPAKSIERRVILDGLRRLDRVESVSNYRYVGFGSLYFTDFQLFHKSLGICDMISIEREIADEARFRFNSPFSSIEMLFGEASEVLPQIDWTRRSIVWLDYDDRLNQSMLEDLANVAREAASGSFLLLSVNAHPPALNGRRAAALEDLGDFLPRDATDSSLGAWGLAAVQHRAILEAIHSALLERNTGQAASAHVDFRPVFHIHYQDGARMLTVGGLLVNVADRPLFDACDFSSLEYSLGDGAAYEIPAPRLTTKEMKHLDSLLPNEGFVDLETTGIPTTDAESYRRVYRYFPRYVEAEI